MTERFFDRLYDIDDNSTARDHYDRFADSYDDELVGHGYAQPDRVATALVEAEVSVDAAVLDAGCGTGLSGRALAARGYHNIHGGDFSDEMLTVAAATGVYQSLQRVDLNARPFPDIPAAPFGAITLVGVLGHGHVGGEALYGLVDLLVPGGLLAIGVNELAYPAGPVKEALDNMTADGRFTPPQAELGDHIPGLGSRGWVITARRL